jgi:PKD repeat protein
VTEGSGTGTVVGSHTYADDGTYTVTITVTDDEGSSASGTWTVIVNNVAPMAENDAYATLEDVALTIPAPGVLANDLDVPADPVQAVLLSRPIHGALTLNPDGSFTYAPAANFNGSDSFTYQAQDDQGALSEVATVAITITPVNDAPLGADTTVTTPEDAAYTFTAADFGFFDPNDSPTNSLLAVKISTLPEVGALVDDGTAVTANQFVSVAAITSGRLVFTPGPDAYGTAHAAFTFQVQDDGGTATGGVDLDPLAKTMTVDVTSVNDAPQGADNTVTTFEDTAYTFGIVDFGFNDPNDNSSNRFIAVKIGTLPLAGMLTDHGLAVASGQVIPVGDLAAGQLTFTPASNADGLGYASFTFQVQDDGGSENGVDLDPAPRTMTVNVTPVNDAPVGTAKTVSTLEDMAYVFVPADFGFSDPNDSPANVFQAVKFTSLPTAGTLAVTGAPALTVGAFVTVADITAGKLQFTPAADANGTPYTSFTFQVQDDGGTANGGVDLDPTPKTLTINVTPVNDAPVVNDQTFTLAENGSNGTVVGTIVATDADAGTALTHAVTGGTGQAAFVVNSATGQITVANGSLLDLETTPSFSLTLTVSDNGTPQLSDTALITISLTNVNEAPVITSNGGGAAAAVSVPENTTAVTTVTAVDPDAGATLSFSLSGGADQSRFAIDATTGALAFLVAPDFEVPADADANNVYNVDVTASDGAGGVTVQSLTVTVTPVNDNNPVFTSTATPSVEENQTVVVTLTATDADVPAQTVSFSLTGGADQDKVHIVSGNQVQFVTAPDVEDPGDANGDNVYLVTVRATDSGGLFTDQALSVAVTNVNEAPTEIALSNNSVAENQGTPVGSLSASDPDLGDTQTLTLVSGPGSTDNASFQIVGSQLQTNAAFDFETQNSFSIRIRATDSGALIFEKVFAITVTDVNEAPVLATIGDRPVDEGSLLTFTAIATDPDRPANALTFSLDPGAPAGAGIDPATGLVTWTPTEAQGPGSYPVTVRVTDNGTPSLFDEETIQIAVREVNQAPLLAALGDRTVTEGTPLTIELQATDPDRPANTLTFTASGLPEGATFLDGVFTWTPSQGQGPGSYPVTFAVSDGQATHSERVQLTVTVANGAPVVEAGADATVDEGSAFSRVGAFSDPDPGDAWTATVDYGDGSGGQPLPLDPHQAFTLSHAYADDGTYEAIVRVTDNGGAGSSDALVVTVTNVAPIATLVGPASGAPGQAHPFTGSFTDPGTLDTHEVAWDFGDGTGIGFHPATDAGALGVSHAFATAGTYTVTLTVRDDDGGEGTAQLAVVLVATETAGAQLVPDPCDPAELALLVTGTAGTDTIRILPADRPRSQGPECGDKGRDHDREHKDDDPGYERAYRDEREYDAAHGRGHDQDEDDDDDRDDNRNRDDEHRATGVEVWINGVSQGVFAHTGRIIVEGFAGADDIEIAESLENAVEFHGGAGDDRLKAGAGAALLLGGEGDDKLIGGSDRNILIGGAGADRLVGGPGDDLLIAGSTIYDEDPRALCTILHAWTSDTCYGTRVARLTEGVDGIRLTAETVLDDGVVDALTGASGMDWFVATVEGRRRDQVTDRHHGERLTALTPIVPVPVPGSCKPRIDWDRHDDTRHQWDHRGHRDLWDGDHSGTGGWVKDFVLELGALDPNRDIQVVLADHDLAYASANGRNGHSSQRGR